jgi:hypothetical protein
MFPDGDRKAEKLWSACATAARGSAVAAVAIESAAINVIFMLVSLRKMPRAFGAVTESDGHWCRLVPVQAKSAADALADSWGFGGAGTAHIPACAAREGQQKAMVTSVLVVNAALGGRRSVRDALADMRGV